VPAACRAGLGQLRAAPARPAAQARLRPDQLPERGYGAAQVRLDLAAGVAGTAAAAAVPIGVTVPEPALAT
jgi:hypothetical protein